MNKTYIHVASAGGAIPGQVNDIEYLRGIQYQVEMLPFIYQKEDIWYDEQALSKLLNADDFDVINNYLESFIQMARKGFVSYDRTKIDDIDDNNYHLVCSPKKFDLKPEVQNIHSFETGLSIEDWIRIEVDRE